MRERKIEFQVQIDRPELMTNLKDAGYHVNEGGVPSDALCFTVDLTAQEEQAAYAICAASDALWKDLRKNYSTGNYERLRIELSKVMERMEVLGEIADSVDDPA